MEAVRPLKTTVKLTGLMAKYWQNLHEAHQAGKLVAWSSGVGPFELLKAMDFEVFFPENYAMDCGIQGVSSELCQRAEVLGYAPDLCSYMRNTLGLSLGSLEPGKYPWGGPPKPDLLVTATYCTGVVKVWEELSRFFDVPMLVWEMPCLHDALGEEDITNLVSDGTERLQEMITFLERFTGRRLDYGRLSDRVGLELAASRLWTDLLEMAQNIPTPIHYFDVILNVFPIMIFRGQTEAITYYQELKAELVERVAHNIGAIAEEKYRLLWDNIPIFFKLVEHTQKFASYGAVPVVGPWPFSFGSTGLDPERPAQSIVNSVLFTWGNWGIRQRIDALTKLVEDYSVDGLVMQRTRTCLRINMGQDDIINTMIERTGLPAVVIEGDMCDSRLYSEGETNSRIDALIELLVHRGPRRR